MTDFPFPAEQIENHRFHGLIQGTFELQDGALRLRTTHGLLRLYPRLGKGGGRPFHTGRKQHQSRPGLFVNAYGYPRTDADGSLPAGWLERNPSSDRRPFSLVVCLLKVS